MARNSARWLPVDLRARGAVDAHHRGFAPALVLGGDQRRVQHQQPGAEREQEDELHRVDQLVDHALRLAHRGADVDHRQVGEARGELVHQRLAAPGSRRNALM